MGLVTVAKIIDNQTVNGTLSIESGKIGISEYDKFGIILVIESGNTPEVKLESQVIASRERDIARVGVGNESGLAWITVEAVIARLTSGGKSESFDFPAFKWGRIKVTGIGSNGSDVKVSVYLGMYEA